MFTNIDGSAIGNGAQGFFLEASWANVISRARKRICRRICFDIFFLRQPGLYRRGDVLNENLHVSKALHELVRIVYNCLKVRHVCRPLHR